jgi:NAD(P)-dependent dehydrogenase (short-subunit alcohol dehydrogenase family)
MAEVRFDNRVAVVTGAGGGLGRSHAMLLASRGAKVVVNDVGSTPGGDDADPSMADRVVAEIREAGGEAVANYDAVGTWQSGENIVKTALDAYGKIDILINNAGILRDRSMIKMTEEEYRKVMEVHLDGTFFTTRAAIGPMKEAGYGRVIFTSSGAGLWGNYGQTNYSTAKLGVVGMMHAFKLEGEKYNITANAIAPLAASRLLGSILSERIMEALDPGYISVLVAYLVSEEYKETGMIYSCGGGRYARAAMVENPVVDLSDQETLTVEAIRENMPRISDLTTSREYFKSRDHLVEMMGGELSEL